MPPHHLQSSRARQLALSALCLAAGSSVVAPAVLANQCPADRPATAPTARPARPTTPGPTHVRGDLVRSLDSDVTEMQGNAEARRDGERVGADYLRHDRREQQVDARGNVTIVQSGGTEFHTGEAQLNLDTGVGFTDAGTFRNGTDGRGEMEHTQFLDRDHTRLKGVVYTTCPPGREDWYLRATTLDLDSDEDVGTARHPTIHFFGVPVLYLPYLSFPISSKRKSGFLMPEFGRSGTLGMTLAAPYYLNLAPDYDATITPHLMTKRGLQLQSEFRYLDPRYTGQLNAEILPNDKVTGENRAAGSYTHRHTLSPYWSAAVDLRGVSDKDYLNEFGNDLKLTTETHLPQNAEINYRGAVWNFSARAADYQTVDRTLSLASRPYARLPQLLLNGRSTSLPGELQYRLDSELVRFDHDINVIGNRVNLNPAVNLPLSRTYGFVTPEIGVRHISYALERTAGETQPSVTAPYATLDSGLFFERELNIGKGLYLQTLEPRLYYVYVPFRSHDHLGTTNFDSGVPDFTFDNLFRNNRFVGGDRIGDTNQVTLALTSRLLDDNTGAEQLRASIGRIHYFDERRVSLTPGTPADASSSSDIVADVVAQLGKHWQTSASALWIPETDRATRTSYAVQYNPAPGKIASIGHRFVRDQLDQVDAYLEGPLWGPWSARARSIYSIRDNSNVESILGLEYNACCWKFRLYGTRRLTQVPNVLPVATEQRNEIKFEIELVGFSGSGGARKTP